MCSTLVVALTGHEDAGYRHRQEADRHHEIAREDCLAGGGADLVEAKKRDERAGRQPAREQRADDPRGLAVCVRLPGVHRREPHLGPVAHEEDDEGGVQPRKRQGRRVAHQVVDHQRRIAPSVQRRVREQQRPEQGEGDPDTADEEIFPGRLERALVAIEVKQRRRDERVRLQRHPHEAEVVGQDDESHHPEEREERGAEDPVPLVRPEAQVRGNVERTGEEQPGDEREGDPSELVQHEPPAERRRRELTREPDDDQRQVDGRAREDDPRPQSARGDEKRDQREEKRSDDERNRHVHSFS
jgi:hypothetical protein